MKKMKKLASLLLAMVMVLAMALPVSAAETGTITVDKAVVGQTYTIYQILDLESYNATSNAYAYKATTAWATFINSESVKGVYVNVDAQGYVTWVEGADVAAFTKLAQAYAKENISTNQGEKVADATTITFTNLDLGYYLVDTTLGTICSLDTTNPTVTIEEKNEAPTITKEVQEDSTSKWGETNDADINQTVNYKATITVQKGAENYVLYDKMSEGLTFNNDIKVYIGESEVSEDYYTVKENVVVGEDDDAVTYTFSVEFDNEYIAELAVGTEITVKYSATLNENAKVGLEGNPNKVILKYGDETKPSWTPEDETITYTWDMDVIKYTTKDGKEEKLSGATFKLSTDEAGEKVLRFHSLGNNTYQVCADADCDKAHVTEITTDSTGTFKIKGIDADTYYLTETAAPAGYNKLADPIKVTITGATENEETKVLEYSTLETKVENNAGAELPSTGGMGTTILYIIGGALVLIAAVLMITKKRMSAE